MTTKVTTRGQVSIPADIRKQFHIEPESRIEWSVEGDEIRLIPMPKDVIAAFRGRGHGKYSTKKLLKDRHEERVKENAER